MVKVDGAAVELDTDGGPAVPLDNVLEGSPPIDIDLVTDIALVGVGAAELDGLAEHEPYNV